MNYFPNATFIEWLWTVMNVLGVVASVINALVIYTRGKRVVDGHAHIITTRAIGLLFVQRVIRSNALGVITTLFALLGLMVIIASNEPHVGLALLVGPILGFCLFTVGLIITGYQILELVMRPEIDEAIERAMVGGYQPDGDWNGVPRRATDATEITTPIEE